MTRACDHKSSRGRQGAGDRIEQDHPRHGSARLVTTCDQQYPQYFCFSNVVQLTTTVSGSDSWDEAKPGDNKFLAVAGYIVIRSAAKRDGRLGRETLIK